MIVSLTLTSEKEEQFPLCILTITEVGGGVAYDSIIDSYSNPATSRALQRSARRQGFGAKPSHGWTCQKQQASKSMKSMTWQCSAV